MEKETEEKGEQEIKRDNQNELREDGILPIIHVEADCLAEAIHNAILACYEHGARIETPKHQKGGSLGYDGIIAVRVRNPDAEPKIYLPALHDTPSGVMQYNLEVTHGIHNHWKKTPENPARWNYTYNERFVNQLPFVFQRIKDDWFKKMGEWGENKGRASGRDYQFNTWVANEDNIPEQPDPPCLQIGQIRFLMNKNGEIVMNYVSVWRSRDELKAWNQNNIGKIELMKLFRDKVSDMLNVPIKLGAYIDVSTSLHLYGLYFDRDNLEKQIQQMKRDGWRAKSMTLDDYFGDRNKLKRLIAAQMDAEAKGHGLNQPGERLIELGYDVDNFPYPAEWDSWPSSWNVEPDRSKLPRLP